MLLFSKMHIKRFHIKKQQFNQYLTLLLLVLLCYRLEIYFLLKFIK